MFFYLNSWGPIRMDCLRVTTRKAERNTEKYRTRCTPWAVKAEGESTFLLPFRLIIDLLVDV
jgi:hypothetical protein